MRAALESTAMLLIMALCLMADGIMDAYGPAVFAAVASAVLIAAEILRRIANMPYYRTCPHCGSHIDPGEVCDCRGSIVDRMKELIMKLTPEQLDYVIERWEKEEAAQGEKRKAPCATADQSKAQETI